MKRTMVQIHLNSIQTLRARGIQAFRIYDKVAEGQIQAIEEISRRIRAGHPITSSLTNSDLPKAETKRSPPRSDVTFSVDLPSDNLQRRTLRPRRIKVEVLESDLECISPPDVCIPSELPQGEKDPVRVSNLEPTQSSKHSVETSSKLNTTFSLPNASKYDHGTGLNITFVKQSSAPEETIGGNSTFVVRDRTLSFSASNVKSEVIYPQERMEELDDETWVPAAAKIGMQKVIEQTTCTRNVVKPRTTPHKPDKTSVKLARKSLVRAKEVTINKCRKSNQCNPGKVWCKKEDKPHHCSKPVVAGNFLPQKVSMVDTRTSRPQRSNTNAVRNVASSRETPALKLDRLGKLAAKTLSAERKAAGEEKLLLVNGSAASAGVRKIQKLKMKMKLGTSEPGSVNQASDKLNFESSKGLLLLSEDMDYRTDLPPAGKSHTPRASFVMPQNDPAQMKFNSSSYNITLDPNDRPPMPSKSIEDYGLDDVNSGDSSDNEEKPKKVVPRWAQVRSRQPLLIAQHSITSPQLFCFFESTKSTPDLTKLFTSIDKSLLVRRSSAFWKSP